MSSPTEALERRYGRPAPGRRPVLIAVVALVALAGIGWVLWAAFFHSRPLVQSGLESYKAVTEHSIIATMTVVRRNADAEAQCVLRAFARDHSVVGELNFAVPADGDNRVTLRKTMRTERRATSVQMMGCVTDGQTQQR